MTEQCAGQDEGQDGGAEGSADLLDDPGGEFLAEIVDEVFLPLVSPGGGRR